MQLTDQMHAEITSIAKYVRGIDPKGGLRQSEMCVGGLTSNSQKCRYINENSKRLSSHKVRLENLLCETDVKGRDHSNRLRFGLQLYNQ